MFSPVVNTVLVLPVAASPTFMDGFKEAEIQA
jgi:hypothetical protein